ncbi:MAG: anti-sigma factor antagonist, partial [Chitinivibrionales bacterium]|nr:anti-sigma factor antagonist [Chitinivibrionales bacterium]MBD3394417.1 anti-sigma factor antagonist [Chitinivibrionales bacterium]
TNIGVTTVDKVVRETVEQADMPKLILNLSDVSYLDSFSFGWIMKTYKEIRKKGGEFAICCPNEDILYLFEVTDFSRVVPAYRTEAEAREAIRTGNQSKRIVYI